MEEGAEVMEDKLKKMTLWQNIQWKIFFWIGSKWFKYADIFNSDDDEVVGITFTHDKKFLDHIDCYEQNEESVTELRKNYYELLFAVARKFPDETRHQTALRYIMEAEDVTRNTGEAKGERT